MSLSGGKGNSRARTDSTQSTTNTDTTTNNVDNRAVSGDGAVFGGNVNLNLSPGSSTGGVSIVTSDYGAVRDGVAAAVHAADLVAETAALGSQTTQQAIEKSLQLAANNSAAQGAETTQKFLKYGAIVAGIALAAFAFRGAKAA